MIREKPAILRLKVKVYLGTLGISQSNVWDEAVVTVDGRKVRRRPDLIVIRDKDIWFWEMKDWGTRKVGSGEIKRLNETVSKINMGTEVKFSSQDGKKEISNKRVTEVTIICGKGGFSPDAYTCGRKFNISLIEPQDLGIHELVVKRVDTERDLLLGVDLRIIPKGVEVLTTPSSMETKGRF